MLRRNTRRGAWGPRAQAKPSVSGSFVMLTKSNLSHEMPHRPGPRVAGARAPRPPGEALSVCAALPFHSVQQPPGRLQFATRRETPRLLRAEKGRLRTKRQPTWSLSRGSVTLASDALWAQRRRTSTPDEAPSQQEGKSELAKAQR